MKTVRSVRASPASCNGLSTPATARRPPSRPVLDTQRSVSERKMPMTGRLPARQSKETAPKFTRLLFTSATEPLSVDDLEEARLSSSSTSGIRVVRSSANPSRLSGRAPLSTVSSSVPVEHLHSREGLSPHCPASSGSALAPVFTANAEVRAVRERKTRTPDTISRLSLSGPLLPSRLTEGAARGFEGKAASAGATASAGSTVVVSPVYRVERASPKQHHEAYSSAPSHHPLKTVETMAFTRSTKNYLATIYDTAEKSTKPQKRASAMPVGKKSKSSTRKALSPSAVLPSSNDIFTLDAGKKTVKKRKHNEELPMARSTYSASQDTSSVGVTHVPKTKHQQRFSPTRPSKPKTFSVAALDETELRAAEVAMTAGCPLGRQHTALPASYEPTQGATPRSMRSLMTPPSSTGTEMRYMRTFRFPFNRADSTESSMTAEEEVHDCNTYIPAAFMSSYSSSSPLSAMSRPSGAAATSLSPTCPLHSTAKRGVASSAKRLPSPFGPNTATAKASARSAHSPNQNKFAYATTPFAADDVTLVVRNLEDCDDY